MKTRVFVTLKPSVFDPQGRTIVDALGSMGFEAVRDVRQGKYFELDVDVDPSSRAQIHVIYLKHAKAEDIAQVLSNLSDSKSSDSRKRTSARGRGRGNDARSSARAGAHAAKNAPPRAQTAPSSPWVSSS